MELELTPVDEAVYHRYLADFLPAQVIDCHAHVWLKRFIRDMPLSARGPQWPRRVAQENSIEDLLETYRQLLPQQAVTPMLFGWVDRDADLHETNSYVQGVAARRDPSMVALTPTAEGLLPKAPLLVSRPDWTAEETQRLVIDGRFVGLKPYLNWAPPDIPAGEITIYDFLPRHQLEVANAHGWIIMLHIPRAGRLGDPVNQRQMLEIERRYPNVRLIIAHIGRAYCPEDVGDAFEALADTEHLCFDISANTCADVMEGLLRAVGAQRVLFGSDLPVVRMRMRRICENGRYVNLVPAGRYGDVRDDPNMREVTSPEAEQLTFFLYEELLALRRAAEAVGLGADDLRDIFHDNAARLIAGSSSGEGRRAGRGGACVPAPTRGFAQ